MAQTYRLALLAFRPTQETPLWDLPGGNKYRGIRNTAQGELNLSNSRKIKRSVKRNATAVGMAALGTVTVGGLLMTTAGTAFAAVPTTAQDTLVSGPTTVYPGMTGQAAGSVALKISNTFSAGDQIDVPIVDQTSIPAYSAAAPTGQTGTTAQSVNYTSIPTVTVTNSSALPNSADVAPTLTETLTTNPNDSTANKNAGLKDMLVITIGNTANTAAPTDTYTVTLSGIQYDVGASAPAGSVYMEPVYEANSGTGAGPYAFTSTGTPSTTAGTPVANANVSPYQVSQTPTGVPASSTAAALSNLVLKEIVPGTFPATSSGEVYTIYPSAGAFEGTATVTATGFTVAPYTNGACGTAGSTATASPTTAPTTINGKSYPIGVYQFCVVGPTTTTPGSLTVSGMGYNASGVGPGGVSITVSANGATALPGFYQASQDGVTVVNQQTVAGYTADDTAAQAAAKAAATEATPAGTAHAVILASNAEYQDALSASFLIHSVLPAQNIDGSSVTTPSGVNPLLLNPYDTSNEAATAAAQEIRKLGAGTVYVIGGTDAISSDVTNQLSKIQIGTNALGQPVYLQVVRIAGYTAEETAAMAAQYPSANPGTLPATPAAYGMYNSGASESTASAAGTTLSTAILADGNEFQDALAASGLASAYRLPVLLNAGGQGLDTSAASAIQNLHIQQVIVVGGSAAVSDAAVTGLENLGVSVLRIAGTTFDATANELAQFEVNDYPSGGTTAAPTKQDGLASPANNMAQQMTVGTSRGDAYQDALSSAQLLGTDTGGVPVVDPLLLNTNTSTVSTGTADFLTTHGTAPGGTFSVYGPTGTGVPEQVLGDVVFGGTLAQTPTVVQTELNDIAAG